MEEKVPFYYDRPAIVESYIGDGLSSISSVLFLALGNIMSLNDQGTGCQGNSSRALTAQHDVLMML